MKERPMLYSAPMVRGLLNDSKTQTRRLTKPQPYVDPQGNFCWNGWNYGQDFSGPHIQAIASPLPSSRTGRVLCPYGKPGDRLWVRETHYLHGIWSVHKDESGKRRWTFHPNKDMGVDFTVPNGFIRGRITTVPGWYRRPSIHMPRWASRITLEITEVRVERLQDISAADAIAEGIESLTYGGQTSYRDYSLSDEMAEVSPMLECPIQSYRTLWNSINGPDAWNANPWVWAVSFKRVEGTAP